ncbi:MAG: GumC family protein [Geminicoccaceae bacterium]
MSSADMSPRDEGQELTWMWRAVRKHAAKIIAVVTLASVAMTAFILSRTKEYTAYTGIYIEPNANTFGDLEEDHDGRRDILGPAELESEIRLIGSAHVILQVMDELALEFEESMLDVVKGDVLEIVDGAFSWLSISTARSDDDGRDVGLGAGKRLESFRKKLSIERDPLAYVVNVGFSSTDAEEAALVADSLAQTYLEDRVRARRKALSETADSLGRSVEELAEWLKTQEREIETFRADSDLYAVGGTSPAEQRYNTLSEQLIEAKLILTDAESRLSQADDAVRQGKALDSIREVQTSSVISSLRGQETEIQRKIADLATRFGANHPIMTNAKAELSDIRLSIKREIDRVVEQLQLEVTVAENRQETLKEQVADAQAEIADSKSSRIRLKELERDAEAPRRVYETMLERYQRAREQEKILIESARVIERAQVPVRPSNVSGILLLGFTAAGSCAVGVGLAFLLELLRPGYQSAAEAERDLGYPVLGLIPTVHRTGRAKDERWEILEAYGLTEAIRSLVYAAVPRSDRDTRDSAKVLAVTSSFPDEGKSTVSLTLARQAAFSGLKVLLIEGDLRKPGLQEGMTQIKPDVGLVNILRGEVHYADDAIATEPESGVDIMLGLGPADDAFTLMRGERMGQLIEAVRPRYDLIVIDAAPIMAVSETRTLIDLADETMFIVRWKTTERSAARAALRDLERMDAEIAGVVLTQVDLREHLKYEDADRLAYQDKYNQYAESYKVHAVPGLDKGSSA